MGKSYENKGNHSHINAVVTNLSFCIASTEIK